ncbi:hypothetical protein D3870_16610 [Noviherbaspirillum cavernae]|uniref:Erythromycin biosynthesis protein CIII-like C-terminal domain-containing protein n=1 Tax=Noviherbaspirillum cavernae TaxID=2320862 RepID=A0A418X4J4_9BURK|nr:nucleotide disphospho-sugar-binding domain-containing protein [Noviherbaspirillum cavernae]RJG07403.1 hypothetical protein D3870_16610 [Noviherbaspirillum cavernae]
MSSIVFAWELGDNFGHLWRMLPIAEELIRRGHQVRFVLNHLASAQAVLAPKGIAFLPSPSIQGKTELGREIASYADILATHGFTRPAVFNGMMSAWANLHALLETDIVVLEHAPSALVAARMLGLKTVHIGTGFTIPPRVSPMPCFRPWHQGTAEALEATESSVLSVINAAFAACGHVAATTLSEALSTDRTLLMTLPELDHYQGADRSAIELTTPVENNGGGMRVPWLQTRYPRIFMYVRNQVWLPAVLDVLAGSTVEVIAVIPDIPDALRSKHASCEHLRIYREPVDLHALLPGCQLAITHAGHGTSVDCLKTGVPMLLLPNHIEQLMITGRIAATGAGVGIIPSTVQANFAQVLRDMLTQPGYAQAAQGIAARYKDADPARSLQRVAQTIESLLQ